MKLVLVIFLLCFSSVSKAYTLNLIVGLNKPPYVVQHNDSGFELEFVRAVLSRMNYEVKYTYVPFGRTVRMLQLDGVDGVLTVKSENYKRDYFATKPYIVYQNVVITNANDKKMLNNIAQLQGLTIAAFQNSTRVLGEDYAAVTNKSPLFTEMANQVNQVKLLITDKVDAIVMDLNIFNYMYSKLHGDLKMQYDVHYLFEPSKYSMIFKNKRIARQFDRNVKQFIELPEYQSLVAKYHIEVNSQLTHLHK